MAPKAWKVEAAAREAVQATDIAGPGVSLDPDVYRTPTIRRFSQRATNISNKPRKDRDK